MTAGYLNPGRRRLLGGFVLLLGAGDLLLLDLVLVPAHLKRRAGPGTHAATRSTTHDYDDSARRSPSHSPVSPPVSIRAPTAEARPLAAAKVAPPAVKTAPTISPQIDEPKKPIPKKLLCRVFFPTDSWQLSGRSRPEIERCAREWIRSDRTAEIIGHADARGSREANNRIGERRALSVAAELRQIGVPEHLVGAVRSKGSDDPLEAGQSEEAWARNRRVEVWFTSPSGEGDAAGDR